ncbi:MAG: B12-binding domain-containing radical SAM protein [Planctomycetota bacterium]
MKKLDIVFANLNSNLYADGSRILSARLKEMGHGVRMVFLMERDRPYYSEHTLEQFTHLCAGADLILMSYLSDMFLRAARLTTYVRERLSAPVVWGGLQATIDPEECMKYVDILCRGEGDEALPEFVSLFAESKPFHDVQNFWVRRNGEIVRNEMRPLLQDLDSNPWPDYVLEGHFIRDDDDQIKPMTQELMAKYHNTMPLGFHNYAVSTARGCAQFCSYCYNSTFKTMFQGQRRLRFRSMEDVVDEVRDVLDRYPFFLSFSFTDDDLFLRSKKDLQLLSDLIHEKLPDVLFGAHEPGGLQPPLQEQPLLREGRPHRSQVSQAADHTPRFHDSLPLRDGRRCFRDGEDALRHAELVRAQHLPFHLLPRHSDLRTGREGRRHRPQPRGL